MHPPYLHNKRTALLLRLTAPLLGLAALLVLSPGRRSAMTALLVAHFLLGAALVWKAAGRLAPGRPGGLGESWMWIGGGGGEG